MDCIRFRKSNDHNEPIHRTGWIAYNLDFIGQSNWARFLQRLVQGKKKVSWHADQLVRDSPAIAEQIIPPWESSSVLEAMLTSKIHYLLPVTLVL